MPDDPPGERIGLRLAVFGAVLVVVFAAAFGIGRLVDPGPATPTAHPAGGHPAGGHPTGSPAGGADPMGGMSHAHGPPAEGDPMAPAGDAVGGLAVGSAGLTLVPMSPTTLPLGRAQPFRFRIDDPTGRPVTGYAVVHERPLHLILLRRDLSGYQHLHPSLAADGTWSTPVTLPTAGTWRAIADFTALVDGRSTPGTLGIDLHVGGAYAPQALPAATRTVEVAGLTVSYAGDPRVGATQPLLFRVERGGLQPYLGAYGHLVVVREGDLRYLHVHPEPQLVAGAVKFWLAVPGPGRYRLFFDFQVGGRVHTAAFTTTVR